ncbi:hypothetical protein [Nocardia sp. NPDC051832]|uniref:hypothetical protein n=1 Tax=Nocardia sp. NPDC051832 TaxID=3155673 RepID=UPI003437E9BA
MRKNVWLNGFGLAAAATLYSAATAVAAPLTMDHDGVYQVGVDISPGYYTTTTASPGCSWARLTGSGDVLESGSHTRQVRIPATDTAFSTTGCGVWNVDGGQRQPNGPGTGSFGS